MNAPIAIVRIFFILVVTWSAGFLAIDTNQHPTAFTIFGFLAGCAFVLLEYALKQVATRKLVIASSGLVLGLLVAELIHPTFGLVGGLAVRGVNSIRNWISPHDVFITRGEFQRRAEAARNLLSPENARIICQIVFGYFGLMLAMRHADWFRLGNLRLYLASPSDRPRVLDSTSLIDGRVAELLRLGLIPGAVVVPAFVLHDLQTLADSADEHRRARGRRGLEVLERLRLECKGLDVVEDKRGSEVGESDVRLVNLCREMSADLVTHDANLQRVAEVQRVRTLNLAELAGAMKPPVFVGEILRDLRIVKSGKEPGQGVGFLEDGTMVVVDGADRMIGREVKAVVANVLNNSAGRILFAKQASEDS